MPPVQETHAVHGVEDNLHPLLIPGPPALHHGGVLKQQAHAMVPHVCTHVHCELEGGDKGIRNINQQLTNLQIF